MKVKDFSGDVALENEALLLELVRAMVRNPTRVRIRRGEADDGMLLVVSVAYEDVGRLKGAPTDAIRRVFQVISAQEGQKIAIRFRALNAE